MEYAIPEYTTAEEMKQVRKELELTQVEFANLLGISKATIERWETSKDMIRGPIVLAMYLIKQDNRIKDKLFIPPCRTNLRMKYMFNNELCTVIDIDERNQDIFIINYKKDPIYRAFGVNLEPTYEDYLEFIESRCFPRTRDKMKIILRDLNIPYYDPLLIIEKTKGRMAEDSFWIEVERG